MLVSSSTRGRLGAERRRDPRASFGLLFLNKYIDGFPYLASLIEMSVSGMLVRKIHEPCVPKDFYSVELGIPWEPGERLWLWTRVVHDFLKSPTGDLLECSLPGETESGSAGKQPDKG